MLLVRHSATSLASALAPHNHDGFECGNEGYISGGGGEVFIEYIMYMSYFM